MSIQDRVARNRRGDKTPLAFFGGDYWIIPQKYSYEARDMIQAIDQKLARESGATMKLLAKIKDRAKAEAWTEVDTQRALEGMTAEEQTELILGADVNPQTKMDKARAMIKFGVAETNLSEGDKAHDEWLDLVMESAELVDELLRIVAEYNRPFRPPTPKTSET